MLAKAGRGGRKPARATARTGRAAPVPAVGEWGIQVGAFSSAEISGQAAEQAQRLMAGIVGHSKIRIAEVSTSAGTLSRARLVGITESQADDACRYLIDRDRKSTRQNS